MRLPAKWALSALLCVPALSGYILPADGPDFEERAVEPRVSEADERFRWKYGVYPPHVRKAREDKKKTAAFRKADRNRDGVVSRAEWKVPAGTFEAADKDGDGHISEAEWKERGTQR